MANRRSLGAAQKRLEVARKRQEKAQATLDSSNKEIADLEQDIQWLQQDPRIKGKRPEDVDQAEYAKDVTVREMDPENYDEPQVDSHDPDGFTPEA